MRLFLAALVLGASALPASAQWLERPWPGIPIVKIVGAAVEGGLGATGLDAGAPRPLVAQSQTLFEGLGLGYQFIVDDRGVATDVVEIHVSGPYRFPRQR